MRTRGRLLAFLSLVSCYESHVVDGPDAGDAAPDVPVGECPLRITHEARFTPEYVGDAYAPTFAPFPDGDLAVTFAGRDEGGPRITWQRLSPTLEPRTPQVPLPTPLYIFGYPVVHTGAPYVMFEETILSLDVDGGILATYTATPEVDGIDWLSPANEGFLVAIHTGVVRLVYIGFEGELRSVVDTEDARSVMNRRPIPRPGGRTHVFAYLRQSAGAAVLREVHEEGVLGPPTELPDPASLRVGIAAMGSELWMVRIGDEALVVDRTDASTLALIEEHRLDPLPEARAVMSLEGRLLIVSSRPGDQRVHIDDFGPDLREPCRLVHRFEGRIERSGYVSFIEADGAVYIGGEVQRGDRIEGWAARLALR